MDLLHLPARFLAGPAAAVLGIDGDDRRERADNLRADLAGPVAGELDLGARHLARFVMWWLLGGLMLPVAIAVQVILNLLDADSDVLSRLAWGLVMFAMWMGIIHAVKAMVAYYLLEGRWTPPSRLGRLTMLSQAPDVVLATTLTTVLDTLALH